MKPSKAPKKKTPPPQRGPLRGRPNTTPYEFRERVAFALNLFELGMSIAQVVRTIQLPAVRAGEIDKRTGKLAMGGLGVSRPHAVAAARAALRRASMRWELNRSSDRVAQKMILEAAVEGAMRDRRWSAVAALVHQLALITGTHEPVEVVITTGDARKKALMAMIANMPETEFTELVPAPAPLALPPGPVSH